MIHLEGREASKALQADGEYISIKVIHSVLHNHMFDNAHRPTVYSELKRISKELDGLSVAIPNKVGHLEVVDDTKSICSVCGTVFSITVPEEYNDREVSHCPFCGSPMEIER